MAETSDTGRHIRQQEVGGRENERGRTKWDRKKKKKKKSTTQKKKKERKMRRGQRGDRNVQQSQVGGRVLGNERILVECTRGSSVWHSISPCDQTTGGRIITHLLCSPTDSLKARAPD